LGIFVPDTVLHVLLAIIFGALLTVNFDPLFGRFLVSDLLVSLGFGFETPVLGRF
jgi:hypothetical protein